MDPYQTSRSVASDLGLHCLPVPLLWDARYKSVNQNESSVDPDQTPRSAASDLGLHCLPVPLLCN